MKPKQLASIGTRGAWCLAALLCFSACGADSPLIVFESPRGGEVYIVGQTQKLRIVSKFKALTLELSRDGGATFEPLGTLDNTNKASRNVFAWVVSGAATHNAVIRATSVQKAGPQVTVSSGFAIDAGNLVGGGVTLPAASVSVGTLQDGAVTTPKLADAAVTTPKIADKNVTDAKISSGQASSHLVLASDGTGGAQWTPTANTLPAGSITNTSLADGAVTSEKVQSLAGNKIIPDFGVQNIQTAGNVTAWSFIGSGAGLTGILPGALPLVGAPYVLKAGDTMTGPLTLSADPTGNLHAATKQYVDAERTRAQNSETTLTTNLNAEVTRATAAETTLTTNLTSETTRATTAEGTKVAKSGDTMTGALTLNADPTAGLHAAPKQYVDAEKTRAQGAETTLTNNLSAEVTRAQGAEGTLTTNLNAEVTRATGAENTLTTNANSRVLKAGDTMTGLLTLSGAPTLNLHAATKAYVDAETTRATGVEGTLTTNLTAETTARTTADTGLQNSINTKVNKAGDTMTGALVLSGDPTSALQAATKQFIDAETTRATNAETTLTNGKVNKSGDTMTGALVLSGDPTSGLHPATKQYVDSANAAQNASPTNFIQNQSGAAQSASFNISGNATIGGNINLTGSIQTGPRMRYISIPAAAFHTTIINGSNTGGGQVNQGASGGGGTFEASVQLPDGSIIKSVYAFVRDNSATFDATISLESYTTAGTGATLGMLTTTGQSASFQQLQKLDISATVNNQTTGYYVSATINDTIALRIVIVGYEISTLP